MPIAAPDEYVTHRFAVNRQRLWDAVNKTDDLAVNAAACDYLDALYQVTRHWRNALSPRVYDTACAASAQGRVVAGLTWLRGQEAHHIATPSSATDRIAEYFYDHYQCWDWTPTPPSANGERIRVDYMAEVAGREIRVVLLEVDGFLDALINSR